MDALCNCIEPAALIGHFASFPPCDFHPLQLDSAPAFETNFDLLTTLDGPLRRFVRAVPLVSRLAHARTVFVGTTVSEYALLPAGLDAASFARQLASAGAWPFVIIKDLPAEPLLVGEDSFRQSERLMAAGVEAGFVPVEGQALAYVRIDFSSIDELLARFSHARRKNVRRKLRSRETLTIEDLPFGDTRFDDALVARIYELYLNVYRQSELRFDLLTQPFFMAVVRDPAISGFVTLYRLDEDLIAFNLCVTNNGLLIDKYIGLDYPAATDANVYTVSWFHNLQRCLELGLRCYVAGWTDPDVKRSLGARFTMTRHLVYARNPLLRAALRLLHRFFESDANWAAHVATGDS